MDEARDLSEWQPLDDTTYIKTHSWWWSWKVFQAEDGLWYWSSTDHDGWDGEKVIDEVQDVSDEGYASWQEAAAWINENMGFD